MLNSDPHGQAALLLCENLLHVLVEQRVITREAALSAIESAREVMQEGAETPTREIGVSPVEFIERIAASFAVKDLYQCAGGYEHIGFPAL